MQNFDVRQMAVHNQAPRSLHLLGAAFHADDTARRTDARGEKAQTTLRATANLDDAPARQYTDGIKQPVRIGGKLLSLPTQAILLCLPIA